MIPLVLLEGEKLWARTTEIQAVVETNEGVTALLIGGQWFSVQQTVEEVSELLSSTVT